MPATINPVRRAILKREMLKGKSQRQALKAAGYFPDGHASKDNRLLNAIKAEICEEITQANVREKITPEYVLKELVRIRALAEQAKDFSTATRNTELLGKFLAMFTDKSEVATVEKEENSFSVSRLAKLRAEARQ